MGQARDREGFQTWDKREIERDFRRGTGERQRGISDVGQARGFRRVTGGGFKMWDRRLMSHVG